MFSVLLGNKAKKQFRELEPKIHLRAEEVFRCLESEPVPAREYDVTKLSSGESEYRIRLSSFRVTYKVYWGKKIIGIAKIERRSGNTYK